MDEQQTREEWFAELVGSVDILGAAGVSQLVIDVHDGRVIAASHPVRTLLGASSGSTIDELVDRGVVARPDLDRLRNQALQWHVDRDLDATDARGELAHSWTDRVRVHLADGDVRELDVTAVHHHRRKFPAEVVMVTLRPAVDRPGPSAITRTLTAAWWTVFDQEVRVVATDQSFNPFGVEPGDLVGVLGSMLVHPEDLPEILATVLAVVRDEVRSAEYTNRMVAEDGGWVMTHTVLRRLHSASGPMYIAHQRAVQEQRRLLPASHLTQRENAVVAALFDGYRVAQLAERDVVSVSTVRTQLKSIYRKLDVAGQAELLARFHRPA